MHTPTVIIGIIALLFGLVCAVLRHTHPELFKKLKPMQERYGRTGGYAVHFIGYTLLPAVVGAVLLAAGLRGISII